MLRLYFFVEECRSPFISPLVIEQSVLLSVLLFRK